MDAPELPQRFSRFSPLTFRLRLSPPPLRLPARLADPTCPVDEICLHAFVNKASRERLSKYLVEQKCAVHKPLCRARAVHACSFPMPRAEHSQCIAS